MTIELIPLEGIPEVEPGDDLAALLDPALAPHRPRETDVVAITQKIVSKAEGRIVAGARPRGLGGARVRRRRRASGRSRHHADEARPRVRERGRRCLERRAGFLTLLPEDPDASAERIQKELAARFGLAQLGVVITDTFGRPWREGVVDVAIGCAGLPALLDLRGTADDHGTVLETTVVALADAVAAASGLVMTKTARVPAALVRGLDPRAGTRRRDPRAPWSGHPADDLFRESVPIAVAAASSSLAFGPGEVSRELLEDAIVARGHRSRRGAMLLRRGRLRGRAAPAPRRRRRRSTNRCVRLPSWSSPACPRPPGLPEHGHAPDRRRRDPIARARAPRARPRVGVGSGSSVPIRIERELRSRSIRDLRPIGIVAVGPMPAGGA